MNSNKSNYLKSYLNKLSTQDFLKHAKNYIVYCESLVETGSGNVLKELRPNLVNLYHAAFNLEELEGNWPQHWDEHNAIQEGFPERLQECISSVLGPDLNINYLLDPFSPRSNTGTLNINEFIEGLYSALKDEIDRLETLKTDLDVEIALRYFKLNYEIGWGQECAVLIQALHVNSEGKTGYMPGGIYSILPN